MNLDFFLSILLSFSAGCYILMGVRLLRGDNVIGGFQLGATFIVLGLWVLGGAVEMMATSFVVFSVGRTAHFVGTALIPVTLLICFRNYIWQEQRLLWLHMMRKLLLFRGEHST